MDTNRGVNNWISSDSTSAQLTYANMLNSFNSNGYTLGTDTTGGKVNYAGTNYASWTFREAPKFFDVVTWTGDGTSNKTVSHSLGSVPGFVMIKVTSTTGNWRVAARKSDNDYVTAYLNLTNAGSTVSAATMANAVNATTLNVGYWDANIESGVNTNGASYVAYLFAHDTTADGIVQCGSFTTDGSNNASVSLGWEPQWVLVKPSSGTGSWQLVDNMRGMSLTSNGRLFPNNTNVESVGTVVVSPNATGFTFGNVAANTTFIYLAIRRGPMRTPTDATKVFAPAIRTGTGAAATFSSPGFAPDLLFSRARTGGQFWASFDRLRGGYPLIIPSSNGEDNTVTNAVTGYTNTGFQFGIDNSGALSGYVNGNTFNYAYEVFARAPGFMDTVCFTGTGSARTVSHNLGVVPELMIVKRRDTAGTWLSYHSAIGNTKYVVLNTNAASATGSTIWNDTSPTSLVFTVGTSGSINASGGTYVASLFATCPGVSKVGTYTGTGTTLQINCGFTNGARFVLIKRTDSTGDWYVYDSARGISAGNDPYLLLNNTDAEVTNTDYVDAYSAGFELSSTAPAALNANGGTYIFLAIA
jgi:hypothetical protein